MNTCSRVPVHQDLQILIFKFLVIYLVPFSDFGSKDIPDIMISLVIYTHVMPVLILRFCVKSWDLSGSDVFSYIRSTLTPNSSSCLTISHPFTILYRIINTSSLENMSTESEPAALEVITIDPAGNVSLVTRTQELRVSSKVLSAASPVFKSMLQPKFQEGTDLAKDGTCRVLLPEDNPEAIHQLCTVLHNPRGDFFLYKETPKFLQEVAILVDKYQCPEAVYYWATTILNIRINEGEEDHEPLECLHLLYAAYIMNISCQFSSITDYMVYSKYDQLLKGIEGMICWDVREELGVDFPDGLLGQSQKHSSIIILQHPLTIY